MQAADAQKIVNAYGATIAETTAIGLIRDITSLPYSKNDIKRALVFAFSLTNDAEMRESFKVAYVSLADFQQLSNTEIRALHSWNRALAQADTSATTRDDLANISAAGAVVTAIQARVASEAKLLADELKSAGI